MNPNPIPPNNLGIRPQAHRGENIKLQDAFFNDVDPRSLLEKESPLHRQMVEYAIEGYNATEIGRLCDSSKQTVSNVLRQPWARVRMQKTMKSTLEQSLREMRDTVVKEQLENIIAIANNDSGKVKVETQLAASTKLLDRFLGTPTQHIEQVISGDPSQLTDEQLARLAAEALEPQPN